MEFRAIGRESVVTIMLYIEGGGRGVNRALDAPFRQGWKSFFEAAGLQNRLPRVVRCGSRHQAFERFETEVTKPKPGTLPLLLVDSEAPVQAACSVWQYLHNHDGWRIPAGATDDHAFLMVQLMETWFLADRDALRTYFGPRFVDSAFKRWPELEDVPKAVVLAALKRATRHCPKPYSKGKVSFELLTKVDPSRVEAACPHAKVLLDRLRQR